MNIYETPDISQRLIGNSYVGRGIVVGKSADSKNAVFAYFIMGRSENSRNRIFSENGDDVIIYPYDESKVSDPSLIIYSPIRKAGSDFVVTNGDQTDTVCDYLAAGKTFEEALRSRKFEPDSPNFTPRISAILQFDNDFSYKMSILKSGDENGSVCFRQFFEYQPISGLGHFIHTYVCDGNPIPTFVGEPERVSVPDSIDDFTDKIWTSLDADNKISLYVRYIPLDGSAPVSRMINKYTKVN